MEYRELKKEEIKNIWNINRGEYVYSRYWLIDGKLKEEPVNTEFSGWPPNEDKIYGPILEACYDRGGFFLGAYEDDKLVGIVVLDSKAIGKNKDKLQLKFLHVDRCFRGTGLGKILFNKASEEAKKRDFNKLYISSCEVKNTVDFYMHLGCIITEDVDKELYELEPEDIHMEYSII